jgi:hypothetical protein
MVIEEAPMAFGDHPLLASRRGHDLNHTRVTKLAKQVI